MIPRATAAIELAATAEVAAGEPTWSQGAVAEQNLAGPRPSSLPPVPDTVVDRVFFGKNQASLDGIVDALDAFAALARENQELDLVLIGRADDSERNPTQLSRRRAGEVKTYLIRRGVPSARIRVVALGSHQPRAAGDGAVNRCVELATE